MKTKTVHGLWCWIVVCGLSCLAACGGGGEAGIAPPAITEQPASMNVAEGQRATLQVAAQGAGPLAYQWRRNGVDIAGATSARYTTPPARGAADDGAVYSVQVGNEAGAVASVAATIAVAVPIAPVIAMQPVAAQVLVSQPARFSVEADGTEPLAYQWLRNGEPIAGATAATLAWPSVSAADAGAVFSVRVSNAAGEADSDAAALSVSALAQAVAVVSPPEDAAVREGDAARFSVVATGTGPLAYQWRRDGVDIAGATGAEYQTPAAGAADDGAEFSVAVSNSQGQVLSDTAALAVVQSVVAPTVTRQPASVSVKPGAAAAFTVRVSGTSPFTYQWKRRGTLASCHAEANAAGLTGDARKHFMKDCMSQYRPIKGATRAQYTTRAVKALDDGRRFIVAVHNAAGSVTSRAALLSITKTAPVIETPPADTTVTEPTRATFQVVATGTGQLTYQWRRNGIGIALANAASYTTLPTTPADNGNQYDVVVSNGVEPFAISAPATLTVLPRPIPPFIKVQPKDASVKVGDTASFAVTAGGNATLKYQWRRDGHAIAGATRRTYTTAPLSAADDGAAFQVVVSNTVGHVTSRSAVVNIELLNGVLRQPRLSVGTYGAFHTLARRDDGSVWGWGANVYGQLGADAPASFPSPARLTVPATAISIGAAQQHSAVVEADGHVYTAGLNKNGVLGNAAPANRAQRSFQRATVIDEVVAVTSRNVSNVAIRKDGTVWTWGYNVFNTTGAAVRVGDLVGAVQVVAGEGGYRFALLKDGTVWFWGSNQTGIAAGATTARVAKVPVKVPGMSGIAYIASGGGHMLAVARDGTVWSWGYGTLGQLGYPITGDYSNVPAQVPGLTGVSEVAAGYEFSLALKRDGTVWAWGRNERAELGLGFKSDVASPQQIAGLSDVTDVAAGLMHSVFAKGDGSVWVCGSGTALGIPNVTVMLVPTRLPDFSLQ